MQYFIFFFIWCYTLTFCGCSKGQYIMSYKEEKNKDINEPYFKLWSFIKKSERERIIFM